MDQPKKYESTKYFISITGFIIDLLILVYLLTSGWSIRIRDFAARITTSEGLVVMFYVLIVGAIFTLIHLPLGFYSEYVVEHRFGLSRQTFARWVRDEVMGLAVGIPLSLGAIEMTYYLLRSYPDRWWIYGSLGFIMLVVAMANLAPVLILPLFFSFKPIENADLQRRVERLARQTGTKICGIFEWSLGDKTRKANAAVIGWGNTRRIIVSDTLLNSCSGEEIEAIMAHELCHHVKNHIWQGMAFQSLLTIIAFYAAHRIIPPLSRALMFVSPSDIATLPLLALVMTAFSLLALPAINYFSRRLEMMADSYALDMTHDALAFVSSMEKLADLNLADKAPNKLIEFIFYSHPSVERRIKLAADRVGQNV